MVLCIYNVEMLSNVKHEDMLLQRVMQDIYMFYYHLDLVQDILVPMNILD